MYTCRENTINFCFQTFKLNMGLLWDPGIVIPNLSQVGGISTIEIYYSVYES